MPENQKNNDCDADIDKDKLHAVLDGEASEEEERLLKKHIDNCYPCLEKHDLENAIKELLTKSLDKVCCPEEDVEKIKNSVFNLKN